MYQKQIEYREELASYYKKQFEAYGKLLEICINQLEELRTHQDLANTIKRAGLLPLDPSRSTTDTPQEVFNRLSDKYSTELGRSNTAPSTPYNYITEEDVKNSTEKVETGIKTFIMDINLMPAEYKDEDIVKTVENYEKSFNVRIIPIDSSRANMQGGNEAFIRQLF